MIDPERNQPNVQYGEGLSAIRLAIENPPVQTGGGLFTVNRKQFEGDCCPTAGSEAASDPAPLYKSSGVVSRLCKLRGPLKVGCSYDSRFGFAAQDVNPAF